MRRHNLSRSKTRSSSQHVPTCSTRWRGEHQSQAESPWRGTPVAFAPCYQHISARFSRFQSAVGSVDTVTEWKALLLSDVQRRMITYSIPCGRAFILDASAHNNSVDVLEILAWAHFVLETDPTTPGSFFKALSVPEWNNIKDFDSGTCYLRGELDACRTRTGPKPPLDSNLGLAVSLIDAIVDLMQVRRSCVPPLVRLRLCNRPAPVAMPRASSAARVGPVGNGDVRVSPPPAGWVIPLQAVHAIQRATLVHWFLHFARLALPRRHRAPIARPSADRRIAGCCSISP
mmetsp:Transcript_23382/g.71624  ORF Transcript_23382/g.71624 Transcript_23382/m.71624 type:complete len:288 (-) Transcript_23382:162-1025(-)